MLGISFLQSRKKAGNADLPPITVKTDRKGEKKLSIVKLRLVCYCSHRKFYLHNLCDYSSFLIQSWNGL